MLAMMGHRVCQLRAEATSSGGSAPGPAASALGTGWKATFSDSTSNPLNQL